MLKVKRSLRASIEQFFAQGEGMSDLTGPLVRVSYRFSMETALSTILYGITLSLETTASGHLMCNSWVQRTINCVSSGSVISIGIRISTIISHI